MNELVELVEKWSINKKLHKAESSKQMLKVVEEVGEVASALARNDMDMLEDGIGDVIVTLIILAQQNGMSLEECLQMAYDEIKGRKGKMIDGVFVKDADLKQAPVLTFDGSRFEEPSKEFQKEFGIKRLEVEFSEEGKIKTESIDRYGNANCLNWSNQSFAEELERFEDEYLGITVVDEGEK